LADLGPSATGVLDRITAARSSPVRRVHSVSATTGTAQVTWLSERAGAARPQRSSRRLCVLR
jgi:hypothetical protein